MKIVLEHRTYEQDGDEWIEVDPAQRSHSFLDGVWALARTALALAAIAAIGIVAGSLALILLPIAFLGTWWLRAASIKSRRP
jgi:hypothetical protein